MPLVLLPGRINPDGNVYLPGRWPILHNGGPPAYDATVHRLVVAASDDGAEAPGFAVETIPTAELIDVVDDHFGVRFTDLPIQQGATIVRAYLSFTLEDSAKNDAQGNWYGHDADDSATFTHLLDGDIDGRTKTTASVAWTQDDLGVAGDRITTPDLTSIVQEIVDRPGWAPGNNISFFYHHLSAVDKIQLVTWGHPTRLEPSLYVEYMLIPQVDGIASATMDFTGAGTGTVSGSRVPPTKISTTYSTWTDSSGSAEVTASVSWLQDDWIIVCGATENQPRTLATPTATGLTFAAVTSWTAGGTNTYVWAEQATTNGSSAISSAVDATGAMRGLAVYVYRGSDGIGASGSSRPGATWTRSLTHGQDESAVVEIAADWNAVNDITVSPTPTTGGTVGRIERTTGATFFTADWADENTAGTTSYGITGYAATSDWSMSTVEILGTGAGAGGAVDFEGAVEAIGEVAGALAEDRPLAAAVEAIGETVGVLARERPMAVIVEAVAEVTGVLTETRPLASVVEGVATVSGELLRAADLASAVEAIGEIVGDITIAGQVTYTGSVEAIGEVAGVLARARDLAGASEAIAEIVGDINIAGQVTFTGAVEAVQDTAGTLNVAKVYAGAVEAVGALSGELSRARILAAVIEAVTTIIGDLNTGLVVPPSGAPWELTFISPDQRVTVNDQAKTMVFSSTQQVITLNDRPKTMILTDNDHRVTLNDRSLAVVL